MKIRLFADHFGLMINVDVTPDRFSALKLNPGEMVYVSPKMARMFAAEDYSI